MLASDPARPLDIARQHCVQQGRVLGVYVAGDLPVRQRNAPVALGLLKQDAVHMMQPARTARGQKCPVEIPVPVLELVRIGHGSRAKLFLDL